KFLKEGTSQVADWLTREGITVYFSVPSIFRRWVRNLSGREDFRKLRLIDLGGESVTYSDVDLYKQRFPSTCTLVGTFGSNETGPMRLYFIDKTTQIPERMVPVGYGVEDKEILILDEDSRELGFNQVGEIAVRSAFLSPGYWKQPELTASAFQ